LVRAKEDYSFFRSKLEIETYVAQGRVRLFAPEDHETPFTGSPELLPIFEVGASFD
jgi:hypothetical protein